MKTPPGQAELFDWVEIHDYECLIELFNNHFENLFEREDLIINYIMQNELYNTKNKIRWPHLFHASFKEMEKKFLSKQFIKIYLVIHDIMMMYFIK